MRQLELREADIDQKQQVLRDMKNKIERNAAIVEELESDIGHLMEAKGNWLYFYALFSRTLIVSI